MQIFYNLFIFFYRLTVLFVSPFNNKAAKWVSGRRNIFDRIEKKLAEPRGNREKIFWFHCASLGEFEQGRPLMEEIKARSPQIKIVLTFFSPSGYEIRKNYTGADYIFYLPHDSPVNARKLVSMLSPAAVFFIKYEFWFNYLQALKTAGIPVFLVSGIFREKQYFFAWYGIWFRKKLKCFSHFFLQDDSSAALLSRHGFSNVTVCGDTRFDRVLKISRSTASLPLAEHFCGGFSVLVAGSTWEEDEQLLAGFINSGTHNLKYIIAPHEIKEENIRMLMSLLKVPAVRYSEAKQETVSGYTVLIVDNMGMLSSLYRYGRMAYIGGGFGKGIHNILEAAVFGQPVLFGPRFDKFREARELIKAGGAFSVRNSGELYHAVNLLCSSPGKHSAVSGISRKYVEENAGATARILSAVGMPA